VFFAAALGAVVLSASGAAAPGGNDFNGDGKDDVVFFRPSSGAWYVNGVQSGVLGQSGDVPVAGDYDGNGRAEPAVFRPSNGRWYGSAGEFAAYGLNGDVPVPADYTGDGKVDVAVYRPSDNNWYLKGLGSFKLGAPGDIAAPADYDGDCRSELIVFRPSNASWLSQSGSIAAYGLSGDIPVPADYDGDGKDDVAVYRPSTGVWYIKGKGGTVLGQSGDVPVPGDYDGDGRAELVVFRPSNGTWYNTSGSFATYGANGDVPALGRRACRAVADAVAPSDPDGMQATATTGTSISISWQPSTDNVGVTGYNVYRNGVLVTTTTATTYTYTGLVCGTAYALGLEARDAAGNVSSLAHATLDATTAACSGGGGGDTQPPSVPTGLATSGVSATSITLSWAASTDNVGVTNYGVYRDGTRLSSPTTRSFVFSGLTCGTSYSLGVDAVDAATNRSAIASTTASTTACATPPPPATGASSYLSPSGADTNPCTQAAPCKTLSRGYKAAPSGGTVVLAAGTYSGQQEVRVDSTKTGKVTFQPATGAAVTIDAIDVFAKNVEFRSLTLTNDIYLKCGSDNVVFRQSKARNFYVRSANNITFVDSEFGPSANANNKIGEDGNGCIGVTPKNIVLDRVWMHDFFTQPFNSEHMECIAMDGVQGLTIRQSKFYRCEDFVILFKPTAGITDVRDITLENNWFGHPEPDGTSTLQFSTPGSASYTNVLIRNNSFDGSLTLFTAGVTYSNFRIVGNVGTDISGVCGSGVTRRYNVWSGSNACNTTEKRAATGYVSQSGFDFHLTAGAAAVGAGDPADFAAVDIDGQARPQGGAPDAGADER